jgi:hypothetical protein
MGIKKLLYRSTEEGHCPRLVHKFFPPVKKWPSPSRQQSHVGRRRSANFESPIMLVELKFFIQVVIPIYLHVPRVFCGEIPESSTPAGVFKCLNYGEGYESLRPPA